MGGLRRRAQRSDSLAASAAATPDGSTQALDCTQHMATDQDFIDYVAEQVALGDRLTHKKMFGEYALYVDGKVIAFACDNSLFVKPSDAAASLAPGLPQRPPYPGAKNYPVADELLDDSDTIRRLVLATAALMPVPKPRKPAAPRRRG